MGETAQLLPGGCWRCGRCRRLSRSFNDRCAKGVLDVLRQAGLTVPADISITGYDDSRLGRLSHVTLTTIARTPRPSAALS
jgi:hypothetical protein